MSIPTVDRSGWLVMLVCLASLLPAQESAPEDLAQLEDAAVRAAVAKVSPSVVRIETLGGLETVGRRLVTQGPTTGLIVSAEGYIVSSSFNFVQMPASILVTLPDGKRHPAKLVARDHSRKLVLLKVETEKPLPVPEIADRRTLRVGQWAIGLGRTYGGEWPSVTSGIVSAKNRIWGRAVQTDVKVSPANYGGPLIDLQGRVIGILVPMSPRQQSEVAGAEWYDSGIGFAVPLSDVLPHLDKLKKGQDLHPGLLGISLKGQNIYADRAEVAAVAPKSPAAEAGLKAGDVIVKVDGQPVDRQAQLKHALGPRYAGETLSVVVERGEKRKRHTFEVTLAKEILPYAHAFLGVLPRLDAQEGSVIVHWVYPESPADQAGLRAGDVLVRIGDQPIDSIDAAMEALLPHEPGSRVAVVWRRGESQQQAEIELEAQPTAVPDQVDPRALPPAGEGEALVTGLQECKVPEEPNECHVWLPESVKPGVPHGLLVWLGPAQGFSKESLEKEWGAWCRKRHFILLSPRPKGERWATTDVDFVHKAVEEAMRRYPIDGHRVMIGGRQSAGAVSFLAAFPRRDLFHGVVAVDAPVPPRTRLPANEPTQRLMVMMIVTEQTRTMPLVMRAAEALGEAKYPVTVVRRNQTSAALTEEQRGIILRWADTLDRL